MQLELRGFSGNVFTYFIECQKGEISAAFLVSVYL